MLFRSESDVCSSDLGALGRDPVGGSGADCVAVMTRLLAAVLCLLPVASEAQYRNCGPRGAVTAALTGKYQEQMQSYGISENGQIMIEVWVSEGGSFTILQTNAVGLSCMIAAGKEWLEVPQPAPGEDM